MAMYGYFCFRRLHILPNQFDDLETNEKAMVIAFIRKWVKDEKEAEKKAK